MTNPWQKERGYKVIALYDPTGKDADFYIRMDEQGVWCTRTRGVEEWTPLRSKTAMGARLEAMNLHLKNE